MIIEYLFRRALNPERVILLCHPYNHITPSGLNNICAIIISSLRDFVETLNKLLQSYHPFGVRLWFVHVIAIIIIPLQVN
jgi:hypothetical protein